MWNEQHTDKKIKENNKDNTQTNRDKSLSVQLSRLNSFIII